jgi:hypothetical protein
MLHYKWFKFSGQEADHKKNEIFSNLNIDKSSNMSSAEASKSPLLLLGLEERRTF